MTILYTNHEWDFRVEYSVWGFGFKVSGLIWLGVGVQA